MQVRCSRPTSVVFLLLRILPAGSSALAFNFIRCTPTLQIIDVPTQILFCFWTPNKNDINAASAAPVLWNYVCMYISYSLSVHIFAQFLFILRLLLLFRLFALKIRDAPPQRWKPSLPEALQVLRNVVNTWVGIGVSVSATLPCVCAAESGSAVGVAATAIERNQSQR